MKKNCLITHVADPDGAFPIILAKLVFESIDVFSCEIGEVNGIVENVLKNYKDYDAIYIVDLNISEDLAKVIDNSDEIRDKIKVFDHHQSNLYLNKYSFIQVVDSFDGKRECGTTLFWKYLNSTYEQPLLNKKCLKMMLELVRQSDTFDFSEDLKDDAFKFGRLYSIYGRDKYIERFYNYVLENEDFEFSELEKVLIELEENKIKKYIEEKMEHVLFAKILNYKVGIVFAELHRSILGNEMANKLDIDIAIIINVDRSVSYRASKKEIDASILASFYNGGGHKHACGSPVPSDLQEKICTYIFNNIEWIGK